MITEERKQEIIKAVEKFKPDSTIRLKGNDWVDIKIQNDSVTIYCKCDEDENKKEFNIYFTDEYTYALYQKLKNYYGD